MSYHKVILDKLFPYAPYLNIRVGIEILVEKGQDPMEAFEDGWQKIHDFRNKHIQEELTHQLEPTLEAIPDIKVQKTTAQSLEEQIENCQTIEDLDTWKIISKSNHKLGMAFAKRAAYLLSPDNETKKNNHDTKSKRNSKGN